MSDIHHLAAAYALDAVDETERAAFEAHYTACDVCRVDVDEFRATLAVMAASAATPPSQGLKDRVMAEVGRTRQLSPLVPHAVVDFAERRRRRRFQAGLLAVAAAFVLVVAGVSSATLAGRGGGDTDAAADVLAEPDTRVVDLDGTVAGRFRVAWSQSAGRAVVVGDGLADPGEGRAYELWLIDASGPHPVRLLDDADGGQVRRVMDVDGAPSAWGVTIEPAEGSAAPTTDVIFVATV